MRKEYLYRDVEGIEVFKKVKVIGKNGKKMFWIESKTKRGWTRRSNSFKPLPYNLHRFDDFRGVIICEGEKDADNVNELNINFLATTAPTGAHNWDKRLTKYFIQGKVSCDFFYDVGNEDDVQSHAREIQKTFPDTVIKIAKVPIQRRKADISDYLEQYKDIEERKKAILEIVNDAPRFELKQDTIIPPNRLVQPLPELEIENSFINRYVNSLS